MATVREIKRHIRSVKNIEQVTRAMQMVAASKMRRAQDQVRTSRPYSQHAWILLEHLASHVRQAGDEEQHPLLQARPVEAVGLVVVTSDRGLAGGYNTNLLRQVLEYLRSADRPVKVITVGRKGRDFLLRVGVDLVAEFTGLPPLPSFLDVLPIARTVIDDYLQGDYDQVMLAYTDFVNTLRQVPVIRRLLPIVPFGDVKLVEGVGDAHEEIKRRIPEYIYEPDAHTLLSNILPRFTEQQVYQAILEAVASEHSARMVAMRSATENAQEVQEQLTMTYHRARQAAITREMLDIAGGAEALRS